MNSVLEALESGEPFDALCEAIVRSACEIRRVQVATIELAPDARQSPIREIARAVRDGMNQGTDSSLSIHKFPVKRFGVVVGYLTIWSKGPLGKGAQSRATLHAALGGLAFERGRSGTQLQALLDRIEILNELHQLISTDTPIRNLASEIARQGAARFSANVALTLIREINSSSELRIVGGYGCPPWILERPIPVSEGIIKQLLTGHQQISSQSDPNFFEPFGWLSTWGIKSLHGGAIRLRENPFGIIILGFGKERRLSAPEEERFQEYLQASSVALCNALNRDKLLAYSEQLEDLVEQRTAELAIESQRAQNASLAKSRFIANISHELRTPLTAIIGFTSLLTEGVYGEIPPQQSEALSSIAKSGVHLKNLINDILDLARIESGKEAASPQPVDIDSALVQVHCLLQQTAAEKGVNLIKESESSSLFLLADPKHLQQILMNLVGNAIKYTKSGGTVEVGSERIDAKVRVWVKDNGVGMSSSLIKKLFERFSRGDDDYSRGQEGTGIGLAIVHQLVGLNNGMIEIDSVVGEGSVFSVIFPMTVPPKAVDSVGDVLQPNPARLTGKTILVLDDDNQSLRIVKNTLEARGAKVLLSDSISAARSHVEQESVNLIITDISLGRECGVGFIEEIRTRLFDLPIIVLSGSAFEEDRRRAFEAGANDFVPKPFETRSLVAITAKLLGVG